MLAATLVSLAVVFVAELGDKSQLMTMTYALRYRWWVVLTGVAHRRRSLVHGVSVTDRPLPRRRPAGAADGIRGGDRVPVVRGVGLARRRLDATTTKSKVAEPRFVLLGRGLVVRARRTRRQDDARHRRRWPATTTGPGSGSARRWAWCWPMAWRSRRGGCCTSGCRNNSCTCLASVLFLLSDCGCCSTALWAGPGWPSPRPSRWRSSPSYSRSPSRCGAAEPSRRSARDGRLPGKLTTPRTPMSGCVSPAAGRVSHSAVKGCAESPQVADPLRCDSAQHRATYYHGPVRKPVARHFGPDAEFCG